MKKHRRSRASLLLEKFLKKIDNVTEWAEANDLNRTFLYELQNRNKKPSVETAAKIERATKKFVPMQAWTES